MLWPFHAVHSERLGFGAKLCKWTPQLLDLPSLISSSLRQSQARSPVSVPFVSEHKEFGPKAENQPFLKRNKIIGLLCYFEYDKWASAKQMIIRSKTMERWKEFTPCLGWGCLDNEKEGGWGTEGWKGRRELRAWSVLRKHQTRWFIPSCSQRRHFITLSYSSLLGKDVEKAPRLSQTASSHSEAQPHALVLLTQ